MSLNVTDVEIYLNNWIFPLIKRIKLSVPPAAKEMPPGLCPRFHADQPVPAMAWAADSHRAVHHLQEDLLEPDLHSRRLCLCDRFFMDGKQKERKTQMSIWWFLLIIAIWFLLQAYVLPKLGISTWLRNSCQLGNSKEQITETHKKSDTY